MTARKKSKLAWLATILDEPVRRRASSIDQNSMANYVFHDDLSNAVAVAFFVVLLGHFSWAVHQVT